MSYSQDVPFRPSVDTAGNSSRKKAPAPGELALIRAIRARAARFAPSDLRLGIGDDCALLRVRPGEELAVTTDLSIAGRHFDLHWHPPEAIGHRTLARGLSDLAAMGARPIAAFLSLGLPEVLLRSTRTGSATWVDRYLDGFFSLAHSTCTALAGGDLAQSPTFAADIVLIGGVRRGYAMLRSGARPGHLLYVTGSLGGAAGGLQKLAQSASQKSLGRSLRLPKQLDPLLTAHLLPQPRLAVGQALCRRGLASAAIDISDGLSTDLAHICEESRVAAEIEASALPVQSGATLAQALHGGEDYELLFTAPPTVRIPRAIAGVAITRIGRIVRTRSGRAPITLITPEGRQPLEHRGWEHFT